MDNHSLIPFLITGSLLLIVLTGALIYLCVYIRTRLITQDVSLISERELHQFQLEEAERVMNETARQIHDKITQSLIGAKMGLTSLRRTSDDIKVLQVVDNSVKVIDEVINESAIIRRSLNSEFIKSTGLKTILLNEAKRICDPQNISTDVRCDGDLDRLDSEKKLLIYRIAQEALQNVARHSSATRVSVEVSCIDNKFLLNISDNGYGIPSERLYANNTLGMSIMKQRTKYLNGQLEIRSEPGEGCSVQLRVNDVNFATQ